jgi:hypothetical protein
MQAPRIIPGDAKILLTSPPGEKRWGFYQFPDLVRASNGDIYCHINVGHDTPLGDHEPGRFFVTRDHGAAWQTIAYRDMDLSPYVVTFSDGSQVSFGKRLFIYHANTYGDLIFPEHWVYFQKLGMKPVSKPLRDAYDNHDWVLYRFGDIPESERVIPRAWRASPGHPWQQDQSRLLDSDLFLGALVKGYWWEGDGKRYAKDLDPAWFRTMPKYGPYDLQVLPDDTLIWAHMFMNPESERLGRPYFAVACLASTDRGRTWKLRSWIANDTHLTSDGYSGDEHALQLMPNGDLYCVMRTVMGDRPGTTMYLAAARSSDGGHTWSLPEPIAPFSVTPFVMGFKNGMAATVYGRPGVYVRASVDSGKTWSPALNVVGPTEEELLKDRWWDVRYDSDSSTKISCGNLGAIITGPDRFLYAYSDFRHQDAQGRQCKVVKVQEFVIQPS